MSCTRPLATHRIGAWGLRRRRPEGKKGTRVAQAGRSVRDGHVRVLADLLAWFVRAVFVVCQSARQSVKVRVLGMVQ